MAGKVNNKSIESYRILNENRIPKSIRNHSPSLKQKE